MSSPALAPAETLLARKIPWRRRLWVRVSVSLVLIALLLVFSWWWPRRGMVAVWRAGGKLSSDSDRERTLDFLQWWDPSRTGPGWRRIEELIHFVSAARTDGDVSWVGLHDAEVDDRWLVHLQRFRKLRALSLHDRQLGTGVDSLKDLPSLTYLSVAAPSQHHLSELSTLQQLESLGLWQLQDVGLDLGPLQTLTNLKSLFIHDSRHASVILAGLPELPNLEMLLIQDCTGFSDNDLVNLRRLPHLKHLEFFGSGPINDAGLLELAQLKSLERLRLRKSSGQISNECVHALRELSNLKQLDLIRGDFTQAQLDLLQQLLPNTTIRVN